MDIDEIIEQTSIDIKEVHYFRSLQEQNEI